MSTNKTFQELQQEVAMIPMLEAKLNELHGQREAYEGEICALQTAFQEERIEVEKLEGRSLARYFYSVIGKLDEKLDQERKEAYAARVKLDAAERELAGIEKDVSDLRTQLANARYAKQLLTDALTSKREELKSSGSKTGEQILELEQKIAALEAQKQEIREAVSAGYSASSTADRILGELESADGWNTWDMIGGGGIITHMAKHSHLDDAQSLVEELQSRLRKFKTELADIQINADMQVNIDGFLRFADYFFDGLFADWAVGDRINESMSSVRSTKDQISRTLDRLFNMESSADQEIEKWKAALDELTVNG